MRVIIANFDAELEMAADRGGTHPGLPSHVRALLGRRAPLLAVLDPDAIVVTDPGDAPAHGPTEILAWAETRSVAALRARLPVQALEPVATASWRESLWHQAPDPDVVTKCHDRRFWLALATARQTRLPETHVVTSLAGLRARLAAVTAVSLEGAWVAKAPFGASGRERVYRWGVDFPEDIEIRLGRLFSRYGELILEPLMKRDVDVGVCGIIDASGPRCFAPHELRIDDAGVFRDIVLEPEAGWIDPGHLRTITLAAEAAGDALAAEGYRGAFGIDAFVYLDPGGALTLHPMCEINARLTFGHLAWARAQAGA